MKFKFATDYSFDEMVFIKKYNCEILSEIKLSKTAFTEKTLRMIKYCGMYVAEIYDEEDGISCVVLRKSGKGEYIFWKFMRICS